MMDFPPPKEIQIGEYKSHIYTADNFCAIQNMPILSSLINIVKSGRGVAEWLASLCDPLLHEMCKCLKHRTCDQNVDMTATALYFMTIDQQSNEVYAPEKDIIQVIDAIQTLALSEYLMRSGFISLKLKNNIKFTRKAIEKTINLVITHVELLDEIIDDTGVLDCCDHDFINCSEYE